jgi:signal transduction histidine kinase
MRNLWENVLVVFNGEIQQPQTRQVDTLLTIFRYASIIRFVISVILWLVISSQTDEQRLGHILISFDALLLTIYLFATPLYSILKGLYLPIALVWATVIPLLSSTLTMYLFFTTPIPESFQSQIGLVENFVIFYNVGLTIPVLLIPLLIVSWLYKRQIVVFYLLGITLLDVLLIIFFVPVGIRIFVALALIAFRLLILTFVGLIVNYLVTIQRTQAKALRDYATTREHLIASQERNRLARELHDTLAHTLSAATVQLEAVSLIWEQQPQKARQMILKSTSMMREGLAETRRALQALRAGPLDHESLLDAITTLADSLMTRYPLQIEIQAAAPLMLQSAAVEHGLYRIVQEAMFNAARHAQARRLMVRVARARDNLVITIMDDGRGFVVQKAPAEGHFGLQGMVEQVQLIGAEVNITSEPGKGTTVTVTLPDKEVYDARTDL